MAYIVFMFNLWAWICLYVHFCTPIDFGLRVLWVRVMKLVSLGPWSRLGLSSALNCVGIIAVFHFVMVEVLFHNPLVPPAEVNFFDHRYRLFCTFNNYWLCVAFPWFPFPSLLLLSSSPSEEAVMILSVARSFSSPLQLLMSLISKVQIYRNWYLILMYCLKEEIKTCEEKQVTVTMKVSGSFVRCSLFLLQVQCL